MRIANLWAGLALVVLTGMLPAAAKASTLCNLDPNNVVQNCGFESGNFTNWTVSTTSSDPWQVVTSDVNSGTYAASTGCVGQQCITGTSTQQAFLEQSLSTTSGDTYTLQFAFASAGEPGQELQVLWDGTLVDDLINLPEQPNEAYLNYTVTGLVGTGSDTLEFLGRQDPGYNRLDDVQVDASGVTATAPEPGTIALLFGGIAAVAMVRRRVSS